MRRLAEIVDDDPADDLRSWLARAEAARPTAATAVIDTWSELDQLHLTIQVVEVGTRVRGATAVKSTVYTQPSMTATAPW